MNFKKITIVGLGLMGGSLAAACRRAFPQAQIAGVSRDKEALRLSLNRGWIHQATSDLAAALCGADLLVLCTPVNTLKSFLKQADTLAGSAILITDVGSVKGDIVSWAAKQKFKHVEFVGAHPMVGSHERGIQACKPDLYDRGFTFVVRAPKVSKKAFASVRSFWEKISPKVFTVKAEEHDAAVSEVSHLPHLAAAALVLSADKKHIRFAGQGFLDTTRIAQGDASVWVPILEANRAAVLKALGKFEGKLLNIRKALELGSTQKLGVFFEESSKKRRQLSAVNGAREVLRGRRKRCQSR